MSGVDYGGVRRLVPSRPSIIIRGAADLDGNLAANRVAGITHMVSGIKWAPGTELWIRWRDGYTHDGIAIDNVSFSASTDIPEPSAFLLLASALLCCICRRR